MSKFGKIVLGIFIALIVGIISVIKVNNKNKNNIEVTNIKYDTITKKRFLSGKIIASEEINVKPQISGIVSKVYVEVGDKVTIGDQLATVEIIAKPENLEKAKQNLNKATINYKNQKAKFSRIESLFSKKLISEFEYNKEKQSLDLTKVEVGTAKEQLYITKKGFSKNQTITNIVKATASGTVLDLIKEGESVTERSNFNEGSNIATIANLGNLVFEGGLNENDLKYVKEGDVFDIAINAYEDSILEGEIVTISPKGTISNGIVNFNIKAQITVPQNFNEKIRSGLSATAEIILVRKEHVLVIPEKEIVFQNDKAGVYVVAGNNTSKWREVNLGVSNGLITEVEGDNIDDNTRIKVIN